MLRALYAAASSELRWRGLGGPSSLDDMEEGTSFYDSSKPWPELTAIGVLNYFKGSPFYSTSANNEKLRGEGLSMFDHVAIP